MLTRRMFKAAEKFMVRGTMSSDVVTLTAGMLERIAKRVRGGRDPLAHLADIPPCEDCPIGGRNGSGPICPRIDLCDHECVELTDAMNNEART